MKLKLIIVAIILADCSGYHNYNETEKNAMQSIMVQDSILADKRNKATQTISLSATILNYTSELEQLDMTVCPPKFVNAMYQHKEAWKLLLPITDKYQEERGELHEIFDRIRQSPDSIAFMEREKAILSTWEDVEKAKRTNKKY